MNRDQATSATWSEGDAGYRALYEHTPMMFFTLDPSGTVRSVNAHGAAELGYEPGELLGQPVLDVFHEDDRRRVQANIRNLLDTPERVGRWQARKRRKDGSLLWVSETVRVVRREDGESRILVICENITVRKRSEQRLREYRSALRQLSLNLTLAEERERRRIAINLHDQVGQQLGMIKLHAQRLPGITDAQERRAAADSLAELADHAIRSARTLTSDLSSPVLYELGLEPALEHLGELFEESSSVGFRFTSQRDGAKVPEVVGTILHRCTRELLRNVEKHARARTVDLVLGGDADTVTLDLTDDGVGYDPPPSMSRIDGFGLFSMREQMRQIGGRLTLQSSRGEGTRVHLAAPIRPEEPGPEAEE